MRDVKIELINELQCRISGLSTFDQESLSDEYAMFVKNHFFMPHVKLGVWDGRHRLITNEGITYIYLLNTLVPKIIKRGYSISIDDQRRVFNFPKMTIADDIFSEFMTEYNEPYMLRDYQVLGMQSVLDQGGGILLAGTGAGKAESVYNYILTPKGWTQIGDISIGDCVITPSNTVARVIGVYPQGITKQFKVSFNDGTSTDCCGNHLWKVKVNDCDTYVIDNTKTIRNFIDKGYSVSIPTCRPITFGHSINKPLNNVNDLQKKAESIWLNDSFIPFNIVHAPIEERIEFLVELFKVACVSTSNTGTFNLYTPNNVLMDDITYMVRSLGGIAKNNKLDGTLDIIINLDLTSNTNTSPHLHSGVKIITNIEEISDGETVCIEIDCPEHLYLTEDFVVTHNTIISGAFTKLYGELGLKVITIVPTASLVLQSSVEFKRWGLDCGRLDKDFKEIDKTHLVTTWQSLRNIPLTLMNFDVIIVDECQAAQAAVLGNLITEYGKNSLVRIGLTGTMPEYPLDNLSVRCMLGNICYEIPAHILIENEYLSTMNIHVEQLMETVDEDYFPDYKSEMDYLRGNDQRNLWIRNKITEISGQELGNSLVLVTSKVFGKKLTKMFDNAHFISGDDLVKDRATIYELFKNENNVIVIATVQVAGTGVSIDRVFNLFTIDLGKSFIRVMQTMGRGLRRNARASKTHCDAYDISSNLKYSKKHQAKRVKHFKEHKYPHTIRQVEYRIFDMDEIID